MRRQLQLERLDNLSRHFILHGEDVVEGSVDFCRPQRALFGCADELHRDTQSRSGALHGSSDHRINAELSSGGDRIGEGLITQNRRGRPDEQRLHQRELAGDCIRQCDAEVRVLDVVGQRLKRKHGERALFLLWFSAGAFAQLRLQVGDGRTLRRFL